MKKQKLLFLSFNILCFVCCIISLFLPYLEKLNIRRGFNYHSAFVSGYEFESVHFSLALFFVIVLTTFMSGKLIFSLIICAINLFFVYLVREFIHFQGFIDHDYDSKTGVGYLLLFYTSIVQFMVISGLSIIKKWRLLKWKNQNIKN